MNSADEIERLRAKIKQLNAEAVYFATFLLFIFGGEGALAPEKEEWMLNETRKTWGRYSVRDWRNLARKAVAKG